MMSIKNSATGVRHRSGSEELTLSFRCFIVAHELHMEVTMDQRDTLEAERQRIIEQMAAITRMRRGTVNEQHFEVRQKDGSVVTHGPYFLYSRTEKGKSFSRRVAGEEVERYKAETENCRRFKELSNRCVMIGEYLAEADEEHVEKKRSRRSGGAR
jgi:hypothetical protein